MVDFLFKFIKKQTPKYFSQALFIKKPVFAVTASFKSLSFFPRASLCSVSLEFDESASYIQKLFHQGYLKEQEVINIRNLQAEYYFEHENIFALMVSGCLTYSQLRILIDFRQYDKEGNVVQDYCNGIHLEDLKNSNVCQLILDSYISAEEVLQRQGSFPSLLRQDNIVKAIRYAGLPAQGFNLDDALSPSYMGHFGL